jgi:hypothetical protein
MYGWPYGVASPLVADLGSTQAGRLTGVLTGGTSTPMHGAAELPPYTPSQGVAVPFDAKANMLNVLDQVRADIDRVTGIDAKYLRA